MVLRDKYRIGVNSSVYVVTYVKGNDISVRALIFMGSLIITTVISRGKQKLKKILCWRDIVDYVFEQVFSVSPKLELILYKFKYLSWTKIWRTDVIRSFNVLPNIIYFKKILYTILEGWSSNN